MTDSLQSVCVEWYKTPVGRREGLYVIKYLPCPQAQKPEVKLIFLAYSRFLSLTRSFFLFVCFFVEGWVFQFFYVRVILLGTGMQTWGLSNLLCFSLRLINLHGKLHNMLALCFVQYIQVYKSLSAWTDFRLEQFYMCPAWSKDRWALIFAKLSVF